MESRDEVVEKFIDNLFKVEFDVNPTTFVPVFKISGEINIEAMQDITALKDLDFYKDVLPKAFKIATRQQRKK